jgi:hypothetical protein
MVSLSFQLRQVPDDGQADYIAAAPPDFRASFNGSALPFASPQQAFDGTPNRGRVHVGTTGQVSLQLAAMPNSYYIGLGTVYVAPTVHLAYKAGGKLVRESFPVAESGVPFRMLTYPTFDNKTRARSSCMFYDNTDLPVRSQEAILRSAGYPQNKENEKMPQNFWGLKPPV